MPKTITFLLILLTSNLLAQITPAERWAMETMETMTLDEKIGQLFMIRAHSDLGPDHVAQVENYIKNYKVGGLCFFQGTPTKQAELTNNYQKIANIPLLIAIDGEWGLGMRFPKSSISYPKQLALGAIQDNSLIYELGAEVANEFKRIGIHVNFAPVADVNNNPENPVINDRSFGENPENVASKSYAYMKGMQDNGLMACAKHFPGHGDTNTDSHHDLPIIPHDYNRLDSIEMMPFKVLIKEGIESVMVAHLHVPTLDAAPNMPSSLSYKTTTGLLRDSFNFQGLIFTDGLEMQGVRKNFPPGEMEAKAILAGNDILLLPPDLPKAVKTLKDYVAEGKITTIRLDQSVKRILVAKYNHGLSISPRVVMNNLDKDINNSGGIALKRKLIEHSITLARDKDNILPINIKPGTKVASLSIGSNSTTTFQKTLSEFNKVDAFNLPANFPEAKIAQMANMLKDYDYVVIGVFDMNKYASKKFGLHINAVKLINAVSKESKTVINLFGSPYALKFFDNFKTVMVSYTDDKMTQVASAKAILGGMHISGKLPVSAGKSFKFRDGVEKRASLSLGYSIPEKVGISSDTLKRIEKIVKEMIAEKAAPGCQIFIAKDGKVVYNKSFGYHTYEQKMKVKNTDLYDLASITKIAATTIAVMKMNESGQMNVGSKLSKYITQLDTTDKKDLKIVDIMAHHAGLAGWIPFYKQTVSKDRYPKPLSQYYRSDKDNDHHLAVADRLFIRDDFVDSIWTQIYVSKMRSNTNYRYSDLGFYLLSQAVANTAKKPFDKYLEDEFYKPLGLERTLFNPLSKFPKDEIVPTENDTYFRIQKVQGHVHDMGSAMLGGVSGHAGLFSNAYELGVIMQMLLNGGYYGDTQFLKPETIKLFTTRYPRSSRRAIGFDMRDLSASANLNVSEKTSSRTYGHTGFTGTFAYVDPDYNLVFVMLANRTYPSMNNKKYIRGNYRERIHTLVYNAMGVPDKEDINN
ncbi:glycoside hydrolase family 3 N-terminal domain-containing protein [Portibacter lacus]|uniref:beta-N-acetylhexosaminidase n=1 Tax=Portibacter lacus TaxID=1099794 RepID=A0AA37SPK7_9BACT|nr:glycoside hydrolase family 3 N-terminal domain-containing protein [Portibacter lacus]GLR17107.1 beta-N-acetylglucosaminidase [Portibacter lacus]